LVFVMERLSLQTLVLTLISTTLPRQRQPHQLLPIQLHQVNHCHLIQVHKIQHLLQQPRLHQVEEQALIQDHFGKMNIKFLLKISLVSALLFMLVPISNSFAASRISNLKATTDPASANPSNFSKTFTFTYTPIAGDPPLENFMVICDISKSTTPVRYSKDIKNFKCTYPKEPAASYNVRVTPVASRDVPIGDPATLSVAERDLPTAPTPTTPAPTTPAPTSVDPTPDWDGTIEITNRTGGAQDLMTIALKVINWMLLIIAMAATIMIIYAGILLVFNGGNESQVSKAKSTLTWAIVGLVVSVGSYALVSIIQGLL